MDWVETRAVYQELESSYCKYKLLYVTPEKIARCEHSPVDSAQILICAAVLPVVSKELF